MMNDFEEIKNIIRNNIKKFKSIESDMNKKDFPDREKELDSIEIEIYQMKT